MICEAIILAGGLGTRLRSAVPDLPKCMAPVAGRPFLAHLLDYYIEKGIERFVFSLGYKHEVIEDFFHEKYPALEYVNSIEDEPLGTGGAIYQAIKQVHQQHVLIVNGDTFFDIDLPGFAHFHETEKADCSLALKPMSNSDRYGVVELAGDNRIISFKEKNYYAQSLINGGVYLLNKVSFLKDDLPFKFSFEKDYLEKYYNQRKICGYVQNKYFIDIGIPDDFNKANIDFQ